MKLANYIIDWTGYCLNHALYGQHLNDQYFLQQLLHNLHFSLKEIAIMLNVKNHSVIRMSPCLTS